MVTINHSYEDQTRRLLAESQSELNAIETEIKELEKKRATLEQEVQAYEVALQGYLRRTGKQAISEPNWAKLLKGKVHREKLITIAKHNGGIIRVSQATDLLYYKKFIKSHKRANAYSIVQALLSDMADEGLFEKVEPGEYRLIGSGKSYRS